jgi:hypothetical protein
MVRRADHHGPDGIDHRLTERWPCVAGFSEEPAAKRIVLQGYASR